MVKSAQACPKREGKNAKSDRQLGPKKKWPLFFAVAHELDQWGTGSELARVVLVPLYHLRTFARRWEQQRRKGSEKKKIIANPNFFDFKKNVPAAAQCSRLVTHVNTLWPLRCLSARIGRDAEGSSRYGRRWKPLPFSTFYTPNTNLNQLGFQFEVVPMCATKKASSPCPTLTSPQNGSKGEVCAIGQSILTSLSKVLITLT